MIPLLLPFCIALAGAAPSPFREASVIQAPDGHLEIAVNAPVDHALAFGSFDDKLNSTGWGIFNVRTSGSYSDDLQHRAAGFLEGYLTAGHIHANYLNAVGYVFQGNISTLSVKFLEKQFNWAKQQAQTQSTPFWKHVGAVLAQLEGLVDGYNHAASEDVVPALDTSAFLILNGVGDLFQIMPAVDVARRPQLDNMSAAELREFLTKRGMCSGLIKVPGSFEDLFMAHSSWFEYGDTDRIFKHYHFSFNTPAAANRLSFSSYPGYLESLDDFYMMDSGLGMVQTSNDILNMTVLDLIKPQSLLAWQRVRVANAMAHSGEEWYEVFRTAASGTYVNQYMVVDFQRFHPGVALKDGTLFVVEEIPGLVAGADQTHILRLGYWPSYNVPFYPEVYRRSGYVDKRLGPDGMYELAPRAKIFRRDQATVVDMASLKRLMRYANYSDPYAKKTDGSVDYGAAICMRGDLAEQGQGSAGGCYDTKVTSYLHGFWNLSAEIVNGPTSVASDGSDGKSGNHPFEWRDNSVDKSVPHHDLPKVYRFDFIRSQPLAINMPAASSMSIVV